jgi:hypothetical protein
MSKQDMKIRVTEANKEAVWAALEKLGYNLEGCNRAKFLYTYNYTVDCFYGACETHFNEHNSPEYILTPQGAFAKVADYFKQPETPKMFDTKWTPLGEITDYTVEKVYVPLPLKPRAEHNHERMIALAKAILEHVTEYRKKVPTEWLDEIEQIGIEMENS